MKLLSATRLDRYRGGTLRACWIDTITQYPIYGDLSETTLYNSSHDISLPLAYVYLRSYLAQHRPSYELVYHPRRLYRAQGRKFELIDLFADCDIVLVSCSTSDSNDARQLLSAAKAAGRKTALGGIYARFCHQDVVGWGCVDFIATGEGEQALVSILDHVAGNLETQLYTDGIVHHAALKPPPVRLLDLTTTPQPNYDGLPIREFQRYMRSAYILATRGCPAPCHFCTSARLYGYSYRTRTPESVIAEICDLHQRGFTKITFADDTIAVHPEWTERVFRLLGQENPGVKIKVRLRADEITSTNLALMNDAGVEVIQFGVESINLSTRVSMHKRLEQRAVEAAFDSILRYSNFVANPLYMLAYPGEDWADIGKNAAFIASKGSDPRVITYISFTTPYPRTGFWKLVKERRGQLLTSDLRYFTNKFPVFLPDSLLNRGARSALSKLVDTYNILSSVVNKSHPTQYPIPAEFFEDVRVEQGWINAR